MADLFKMAKVQEADYGTSYALIAFIGWRAPYFTDLMITGRTVRLPFVKNKTTTVNNYVHFHNAFGLEGVQPGPSRISLFIENTWFRNQDYPENGDNHGAAGSNMAFYDGHVEWGPQNWFIHAYEWSQDDNRIWIFCRARLKPRHRRAHRLACKTDDLRVSLSPQRGEGDAFEEPGALMALVRGDVRGMRARRASGSKAEFSRNHA